MSAPFSGIEVYVKNVRRFTETEVHGTAQWIWLTRNLDLSGVRGMLMRFVNWTVKASYFTHARISAFDRAGERFDAAFFNHVTPLTFLFSFRRRVPTVLSLDSTPMLMEHYPWFYGKNNASLWLRRLFRFKYHLTRRAYADASFILAWSEIVRTSLIEDYHLAGEKIVIVPPGVDLGRFTPADRSTRDPAQRLKILFVGGDFIRKGGDVLLALAHERRFQHHEFHFVTHGFEGERGVNVFVHENIEPASDTLPSLYRDSDIFVLPTRGDFCPTNAICEAMASALPVIATNVGGLDEIVKDRATGLIVGVDEKEQLGDMLEELSADRELRLRLGRAARTWVEEKYDIKKNCQALFAFLRLAAERKTPVEPRA